VNSPSGSTLQCDTWLWDDMPLNSPGGSTLQCGKWLWVDMPPLNSPKRPPYSNSTSGSDFDHIIAVDMSFCTSLRNFIQIGPPSAEKNDVMSIFKMADLSHLGFYGSNNGFFEKPNNNLLNCLVFQKIAFLHFLRQHPRWRISAILDFRGPVMGSLKSPFTTSYRSSMDTAALNCLVFEKIAFLHFGVKIQGGRSPPSSILGVQ